MKKPPANFWIYAAIAAVALIAIIIFGGANKWNEGMFPSLFPQPPAEPVVTLAPAGQVPASFPKELILDDTAKVTLGDTVKYPDGRTQSSAKLSSNKSMDDLFGAYMLYLNNSGWQITKKITTGKSRTIVASKDGTAGVTVDILANGKKLDLFVNYVTR